MAEYLAMLIDEVPKQIEYFSQFSHFLKNLLKCLITYATKCMADAILKAISIKQRIVKFQ